MQGRGPGDEEEGKDEDVEGKEADSTEDLEKSLPRGTGGKVRRRVSLFLLVVLTLGFVDLVFAVDSVTAKTSMVDQFDHRMDLFLNFASSAFTMATLRSLYFIIGAMVHLVRLLKYGCMGCP